jgi:hypothetical protein
MMLLLPLHDLNDKELSRTHVVSAQEVVLQKLSDYTIY